MCCFVEEDRKQLTKEMKLWEDFQNRQSSGVDKERDPAKRDQSQGDRYYTMSDVGPIHDKT